MYTLVGPARDGEGRSGKSMTSVCVATLLFQMISGCDGYTRLAGTVVDSEGAPIVNAKLVLVESGEGDRMQKSRSEAVTDSDGHFSIATGHPPVKTEFTLSVSKPGYAKHVERVESNTNVSDEQIVLRSEE